MTVEKMDGGSFDEAAANVEAVKRLFPEALREGKIDFDVLRQCLGAAVEERRDFYQMVWNGKEEARAYSRTRSQATLRPCRAESKNWDATRNLYIEGDNLEVLKLLQGAYHGQVKMIYIDPPYNTGHDFVYRDNFHDSLENYRKLTGQTDAEGKKTSAKNTETSGRYHTDWLNMIFPRLLVARNLLRDDGVIFISIDDNEVANLRKLCDEVFGEDNFVAQIVWQKIHSIKNDAHYLSDNHEYVLLYAKSKDCFSIGLLPRTAEMNERYRNIDNDPRGPWQSGDLVASGERSTGHYIVTSPVTGKQFDVPQDKHWVYSEENLKALVADNRVYFGVDGNAFPRKKRFLSEVQEGTRPSTLWLCDDVGHNQNAARDLKELFGEKKVFDFPKPIELVKRMMTIATTNNFICMDFFSGSATTAHAVMQLNAEDGGNRRFICVQLPEVCAEGSEAAKAGYRTICEIGKERIRRAGEKILGEWRAKRDAAASELNLAGAAECAAVQPDVGFRVFKLDTSNIAAWNPNATDLEQELVNAEDNILMDRTREDLLYEILIKSNIMPTAKIEEHPAGCKTIYIADGGALLACLDDRITAEVADEMVKVWKGDAGARERVPPVVVFRETGFATDEDKANALTALRSAGVEVVRTL